MKTISLSKSRYSGLAGLLENAPVLAALQACYRQYGQPAEAFGLNFTIFEGMRVPFQFWGTKPAVENRAALVWYLGLIYFSLILYDF